MEPIFSTRPPFATTYISISTVFLKQELRDTITAKEAETETMSIRILTPDVVSKIAAGEVIERPASVVKELVENSLDAGASQISIEVKGGGTNSIRVSDNGAGIPHDEAELAFQRHATSKITDMADLESNTSLGFRGEALPSIAQVAQIELLTRAKDEVSGTYLRLQNGKVIERSVRAHPQGTRVTVSNLFRDVPARLKFLKSSTTENSQISHLVTQYGLAFPEVRFSLIIDGRPTLRTPGSGKIRDVLAEVYGLEAARAMLQIEKTSKEGGLSPAVSGYVSPSSLSRASRNYLSFFVNQRWIQSRLLARAVEKAYEGLLGVGRYPIAVINLSMPPRLVDVNVHPTKREIRFSQEPVVFNTVYGTVHRTLVGTMPVPEIGSSFATASILSREAQSREASLADANLEMALTPPPPKPASASAIPLLRVLGQVASTYIIAEGPDGLYLIDQHAAHERVLFERILSEQAEKRVEVQSLLEPLSVELSPSQEELLKSREEILCQFGFAIEPFGERTYLLRAIPAILAAQGTEEAVKAALDSLEEEASLTKREERIAASLACHGAVRAGQTMSQEEMRELVRQMERADSPRTCPHGRPTMIHLSSGRLEKEFGRA